ncbi:MAG: hypothetical protein E7500_08345 [Ruminococcus sp.]|nr:hypothetical protein [Ruminococcus sp.]
MKKALKTMGIVLGVVLAIAIVLVLVFPGAYHYYNVKKTCMKINITSSPYPYTDVAVPEDWVELTANGITMKIPQDMFKKENSFDAQIYIDGTDDPTHTKGAFIMDEYEWGEFSLYNETDPENKHTKEEYIEFFERVGLEYPESYLEMYQGFYDLSMEDFNIHSFKDATAFATIALMKEILVSDSFYEIYETEIDGCTAFIQMYKAEEDARIKNRCVVEIYPEGSPEISYGVLIGAYDEDIFRQMIASVHLAQED